MSANRSGSLWGRKHASIAQTGLALPARAQSRCCLPSQTLSCGRLWTGLCPRPAGVSCALNGNQSQNPSQVCPPPPLCYRHICASATFALPPPLRGDEKGQDAAPDPVVCCTDSKPPIIPPSPCPACSTSRTRKGRIESRSSRYFAKPVRKPPGPTARASRAGNHESARSARCRKGQGSFAHADTDTVPFASVGAVQAA